jgi:arabinose-5-phosphate isomerase
MLLPVIKNIGAKMISITANSKSTLARYSDVALDIKVKKEACPLGLAPTASTTAMLALGDAIAMVLFKIKGFKQTDFAFYHPGGNLGKRLLLKVDNIMRTGKRNPIVKKRAKIEEVLIAITKARAGSAIVVDNRGCLIGIFTDGDLRRHLKRGPHILARPVFEVMTKTPKTIQSGSLAAEALKILREKKIDEIPVVDKHNKPLGIIDVQDIIDAGIL